jgi:hypothetical protein
VKIARYARFHRSSSRAKLLSWIRYFL